MMKNKNNIYEINKHPKYKKYGENHYRNYIKNRNTGTLGFQKVEVGNMNNDYITRPEFEEHQKHMDTRFDGINDKISLTKDVLSRDIKNAVSELKNEINDKKVTSKRFWIGISVPAILSLLSLIVTVLVAIFL